MNYCIHELFFICAKYFSASLLEGHLLDLEISAENHVVVGLKEWQLCLEYRGFIMEKAPPCCICILLGWSWECGLSRELKVSSNRKGGFVSLSYMFSFKGLWFAMFGEIHKKWHFDKHMVELENLIDRYWAYNYYSFAYRHSADILPSSKSTFNIKFKISDQQYFLDCFLSSSVLQLSKGPRMKVNFHPSSCQYMENLGK